MANAVLTKSHDLENMADFNENGEMGMYKNAKEV
jgi:hypothetical protein